MAKSPQSAPAGFETTIAAFAGKSVLVVGDIILDRYIWGEVDRTSPEAPVPIVRLKNRTTRPGGAANVVANLAALGIRPLLAGVVGADESAGELKQIFREMGVPASGLIADKTRPTTVKTRVLAQGQQLLRMDEEVARPLPAESAERLIAHVEKSLPRAQVLLLSDYAKGVLTPDTCRRLIKLAHQHGKPVVVDPKGQDYTKYRGADLITPNQKEAQAASGVEIADAASLKSAAAKLQRIVGGRAVVITRGAEGVAVFEKGVPVQQFAARAPAVFDVTGAGDSFIATLAAALATGTPIAQAAELGNMAGAIVVGKLGAATVEPSELLGALMPVQLGRKLRSAKQLDTECQALRAGGRRVVFTNGCFDLLHLGHMIFLQHARQLGDALVVAINSDRSVRALRGRPRPVLGETERAGILGALEAVDFVVIFDEDEPTALIEALRPDVLVKGGAIEPGQVVGREIVERYGGKVEILGRFGEQSTDGILERMARETGK